MSALPTPLKLLSMRKKRTPDEIRQISSVYLPTELWLWIRRFLMEEELRALSRVCFIFQNIFEPYLPFRVFINCEEQPRRLRQRLSALAEYPSLLPRISEIEVKMTRPFFVNLQSFKPAVLDLRTTRTISVFLRNVPHMRRLHTARFSKIKVEREHLMLLSRSNSLYHLILFRCGLPRSVRLPPLPIHHLTLSLGPDYEHMGRLLGHCSANLGAFHFAGRAWQVPGLTELPLFPKLRKLNFTITSGSISHLDTLTSLAPQLEHLEAWVTGYSVTGLSALPASLTHLRINQWLIESGDFGTRPFVHVRHLDIIDYVHVAGDNHRGPAMAIIQCIFPNLTSLDVGIHYSYRNIILLLARTLPNVTRLKLSISLSILDSNDATPYIAEPARGPLASLYVHVLGSRDRDMERYKTWVTHTIFGPTVGLGGPHLRQVEVAFSTTGTSTPVLPLWCWRQVKKEWVFDQY